MQQESAFKVGDFPTPFAKTGQTVKSLSVPLSLPSQLPLRRNIGLGLLSKTNLFLVFVGQLAVSWFCNVHFSFSLFSGASMANSGDYSLVYYAVFVFLPLGAYQHMQWLAKEKCGEESHFYWKGDSWLTFLPLPPKYLDLCDPALAILTGLVLRYRLGCATTLGLWLMISGLAFFIVERSVYRQALDDYRRKRGQVQESEWAAHMIRPSRKQPEQRSSGNGDGIATGSDASLEAQIESRRKKVSDTETGGMNQ